MITLTPAELIEVTNKRRPSAQARVLRGMGIAHRIRPDGTVLVLRNSLFDGPAAATVEQSEIRWG